MNKALLLVDIQNDYFPNGRMELYHPLEAANNAAKLLEYFRLTNKKIFHIQHVSLKEGATFFLPDTKGIEIHPSVKPLDDEMVITKHFPNCFFQTDLLSQLSSNDVTELVICGMMTHMCIDATVRAAKELGFTCTLIEDACTTKDLSYDGRTIGAENVHDSFISALNGTYATVYKTIDYLEKYN